MKTMKIISLYLVSSILLASCGKTDDQKENAPKTPSNEAAVGLINDTPWQFAGGFAEHSYMTPSTKITVTLLNFKPKDPCDIATRWEGGDGRYVIFNIPELKTGELTYPTSKNEYITLESQGNTAHSKILAAPGNVYIDSNAQNVISGRIVASYKNDANVNGSFSVPLCKDQHPY
jgi:hypothetical protein